MTSGGDAVVQFEADGGEELTLEFSRIDLSFRWSSPNNGFCSVAPISVAYLRVKCQGVSTPRREMPAEIPTAGRPGPSLFDPSRCLDT